MAPDALPPVPLSAPGLIGPYSILNPPGTTVRGPRHAREPRYAHVRLQIDLRRDPLPPGSSSRWERLESLLTALKVVESADLVRLAAQTLHALAAQGFRRVDHWEVVPGGWLPPPSPGTGREAEPEPLGDLLALLSSDLGRRLIRARSFSVRASDRRGNRVDVVIRRVHRKRQHTLTVDLWGTWTVSEVRDLVGSIATRLPIDRARWAQRRPVSESRRRPR